MKHEIGHIYHLEVELITPVSIGDGSVLSPLSDYYIKQGKKSYAKLLNKSLFEKALEKYPASINDYIQKVNIANQNKEEDKSNFLPNFIKESLKNENVDDFFIDNEIEVIGKGNPIQLNTCIKERGTPYIPGSSIKGAIKSALFYRWLQEVPQQEELEKICHKLLRKQPVNKEFDELINVFFENDENEKRKSFSLLRVSDAYFNSDKIIWIHCKRFRTQKDSGKKTFPLFKEAIKKGETAPFELFIEDTPLVGTCKKTIQPIIDKGINHIREAVNQFSLANLDYEINTATNKNLNSFIDFSRDLVSRIKNESNRTMFLPIGSGKSNFYQSIGLAIWEKSESLGKQDAFYNFLNTFIVKKKNVSTPKPFPLTRNLIEATKIPLGWVCIYPKTSGTETEKSYSIQELKNGQVVQATIIEIKQPHSKVQIQGIEGKFNMTGTKRAMHLSGFKKGSKVNVKITLNKQGKISQTSFIELI